MITLAEAQKLSQDDLVGGVIENIVTVNTMFELLPFGTILGNAKTYNRELTLGDSEFLGRGDTITAKAGETFTKVTTDLTTIVGDAEVNGLDVAQGIGGQDAVSLQIASKAKSVARTFQNTMVNGLAATANEFSGMIELVSTASQIVDAASTALSLDMLDDVLIKVVSKGADVDFLVMHGKAINKLRSINRALGGTDMEQVSINGIQFTQWAGVTILRNDYIPVNLGVGTNETVIFAGNFDDGSEKIGLAGMTGANNFGIQVEAVGISEDKDQEVWRVKFYNSLALFSDLGLAKIANVIV